MKCPVNGVMPHQRPPDTAEVRSDLLESIELIIFRARRPPGVRAGRANRGHHFCQFEGIERQKPWLRLAPNIGRMFHKRFHRSQDAVITLQIYRAGDTTAMVLARDFMLPILGESTDEIAYQGPIGLRENHVPGNAR